MAARPYLLEDPDFAHDRLSILLRAPCKLEDGHLVPRHLYAQLLIEGLVHYMAPCTREQAQKRPCKREQDQKRPCKRQQAQKRPCKRQQAQKRPCKREQAQKRPCKREQAQKRPLVPLKSSNEAGIHPSSAPLVRAALPSYSAVRRPRGSSDSERRNPSGAVARLGLWDQGHSRGADRGARRLDRHLVWTTWKCETLDNSWPRNVERFLVNSQRDCPGLVR